MIAKQFVGLELIHQLSSNNQQLDDIRFVVPILLLGLLMNGHLLHPKGVDILHNQT